MDTITHTLFGLALYAAVDKKQMSVPLRRSLLFTTLVGSQIPDIDVISQWWDTHGQYQMWHRGLTHSLFLVPIWALLIQLLCRAFWKVKDSKLFLIGLIAVFIHDTSDLFNAWGTGYLEPFSSIRVTFGTIPIVDLFIWAVMLAGFLFVKLKRLPASKTFKAVWAVIAFHFLIQSVQGYAIYQAQRTNYDQIALSAGFIPSQFQVIGKKGSHVDILSDSIYAEPQLLHELESKEEANLDYLFQQNPKAHTLYQWSPFVVIIDEEGEIGIYDPRFYRNGQSFLFEKVMKQP